jgi:hypothetical protein
MENFPSNSREPRLVKDEKPQEKVVLKVIEGGVVRRKKPLGTRLPETFFGGDTKGVFEYVIADVLIPAWQDMVADAVTEGIQRMVFGESRPVNRRVGHRPDPRTGPNNATNYNRYSRREEPRPTLSRRARATHDFDEIVLPTRSEALDVISHLEMIIDRYEATSVKDLYDLVGEDANYTDEKWGWTDLSSATVRRVSNGYVLSLPKTEALD